MGGRTRKASPPARALPKDTVICGWCDAYQARADLLRTTLENLVTVIRFEGRVARGKVVRDSLNRAADEAETVLRATDPQAVQT